MSEKTKAQLFPSPNRAVNTILNEGTPKALSNGNAKAVEKTPITKASINIFFFLSTSFTSFPTILS